jgi:hypothetical protein
MFLRYWFVFRCRMTAMECLSHPWLSGVGQVPRGMLLGRNGQEETEDEGLRSRSPSPPSFRHSHPHPPYVCSCGPHCGHSQHDSIANSPVVEIIHDRGIICWSPLYILPHTLFYFIFFFYYSVFTLIVIVNYTCLWCAKEETLQTQLL